MLHQLIYQPLLTFLDDIGGGFARLFSPQDRSTEAPTIPRFYFPRGIELSDTDVKAIMVKVDDIFAKSESGGLAVEPFSKMLREVRLLMRLTYTQEGGWGSLASPFQAEA